VLLILRGTLPVSTKYRRLDTTTLNAKFAPTIPNVLDHKCSRQQLPVERDCGPSGMPRRNTINNFCYKRYSLAGRRVIFSGISSTDNVNSTLLISGETWERILIKLFLRDWQTSTYFRRNVTSTSNGNTCWSLKFFLHWCLYLTFSEGTIPNTNGMGSSKYSTNYKYGPNAILMEQ